MESHDVILAAAVALFTASFGVLIGLAIKDQKMQQMRYERCIEAGMQWHKGSCLK
jgi:regulator of PEP synthase PpsR (kinase-PPPase family)